MRHRLLKRGLAIAGLHLLAFGGVFALASPMLNVEDEPSRFAVASSRVMLALLEPALSMTNLLRFGELPLILINSLFWGSALDLVSQLVAGLARRIHRA